MTYQTQNYNRGSNSGVPNEVVTPSRAPQHEGRASITYNPRIDRGSNLQCNAFMVTWSTGGTFHSVANFNNSPGENNPGDHNDVEVPIESQFGSGFNPSMPTANVPTGQYDWRPPHQATCGNTFDTPLQMDHHAQAQVQQGHTTAMFTDPALDGRGLEHTDDIQMMSQLHNPPL